MRTEYKNKATLYQYFLSNPSLGKIQLTSAPIGWVDGGFKFSRSAKYWGMFRSRSDQVLSFVKEGRRFLINVLDSEGVDGNCEYIEKKFNFDTYEYEDYFTGRIDFSTKVKGRKTFDVTVIDSQFEATLRNREDISVQLFNLMSIDQQEMVGYTNEAYFINLKERIDYLFSELKSNKSKAYNYTGSLGIVPLLQIVGQEDDNIRENTDSPNSVLGSFFKNDVGNTISIEISGVADFIATGVTLIPANVDPVFRVLDLTTDALIADIPMGLTETHVSNPLGDDSVIVTGDIDISYDMPDNSYIIAYINLDAALSFAIAAPLILNFTIKTETATIPQENVLAMLYHEAFNRIVQSYTDTQNAFYSDLLGRTDSEPRTYASDGDFALGCFTNGKLIRGFSKEESVLSISLKDAFETINKIRCACFTVEEISGQKVARIESMEYAFDERVILTIDNSKDIKFEYAQDYSWNKIKVGYDKAAYEERNGLLEYNNKSEYSTIIKSVKNELDLVSPSRADNAGITEGRNLPKVTSPTTDSDIDEDNFVIDLVRSATGNDVVNGDFENALNNWNITTGGVTIFNLLGTNLAYFLADSKMNQVITYTETKALTIKFSYNLLKGTTTGDTTLKFGVKIDDGVNYYGLAQDGSWTLNTVEEIVYDYRTPIDLFSLQSLDSYSIQAQELPIAGDLTIEFTGSYAPFVADDANLILDDVFISDDAQFSARTDEGFDNIENTLNNEKSFNIRYSPGHMIENWGQVIRAPLDHRDDSYLVYNTSDKNSDMISQETGGDEIKENTNIQVSDLDDPRWLPELIKFDAPVSIEDISTINSNFTSDSKPKKYGIIKVRDELDPDLYYYGWLIEVNSGAKTKEQQWTLLQVNTNKLTPVES